MFRLSGRVTSFKYLPLFMVALLVVGVGLSPMLLPKQVHAAELIPKSIKLSDSRATMSDISYELSLGVVTTGLIGSIAVEFCSNSPIEEDPCLPPEGFDASSAALANQDGETGFVLYSGALANAIILTRPPTSADAESEATYTFSNITNPANEGSLFGRILTYPTSDATGAPTDSGGVALMILSAPTISAEVPPYLLFCLGASITDYDCNTATEPFTDIGTLGPKVTGLAESQMLVATNAEDGYSSWVLGATMTSGNNILPTMEGAASQKGVSQFGINLRANTDPMVGKDAAGPGVAAIADGYNQPNQFIFQSGDFLVSTSAPDDFRKYTISYVVNVAPDQPGGVYATTLTYLTLANF